MALEFASLKKRAKSGLLNAARMASATDFGTVLKLEDWTNVVAGDRVDADRKSESALTPDTASI